MTNPKQTPALATLAQAWRSGRLAEEEAMRLMEAAPRLVDMLCDGLAGPFGTGESRLSRPKFRGLAREGKLTAERLEEAMR